MISGTVDPNRHPVVPLAVSGLDGQHPVQCLLDTGFNGGLTLPQTIIRNLGLSVLDSAISILADGSRVEVPIYRATVLWDGLERSTTLIGAGLQPLLGTSLLLGHRLTIGMQDGGRVTIEAL